MSEPEELFERYRRVGDVAAFGQLYDALAPELLALAVRLAPSVGEAEDLVQSSFVALLERPRAFRRGARLAPFLVGVLARQAGAARRKARREVDPRLLGAREVETPERASLAAEVDAELGAALARLPEVYRDALRMHLVDGRRAIEIALRLGRTPGTVATQLQRGLELLRRALPRGLAGVGLAALLPRGEAAVRAVLMSKAEALAAAPLATSSSLASIGALFMSGKLAAALLALALVALSVWLLDRAPEAGSARAVGNEVASRGIPAPSPALAADAPSRAPAEVAPDELPLFIEIEPPAPDGRELTLLAHVRGVATRHLAELRVEATRAGAEPVSAAVDLDGTARLELGPLLAATHWSREPLRVSAAHPLYLQGSEVVRLPESSSDEALECELRPQAASALSGRVLVPPGADPRAVQIELHAESGEAVYPPFGFGEGPCDDDGRFRLALSVEGLHRVTASSPQTLPVELWCRMELLEELALPDLVLEPGTAEIHGRAELPPGVEASPLGGLTVLALRRDAPPQPPRERRVIDRDNAGAIAELRGGPPATVQRAMLDERGRFALRGLEPGLWELELHGVAASALLPTRAPRVVEAPATGVVLWEERSLLAALVVDASGPVSGAQVSWRWQHDERGGFQQTFTDGEGRVVVVGDRTTDYALVVSAPGCEPVELVWSAAGRGAADERRVELGASLASALELVPTGGSTRLERAMLRLAALEGEREVRHLHADLADGRYRFERLEPGRYRARLGPADHDGPVGFFGAPVQPVELELELAPGETTRAPVALVPGGRVRVTIDTGEEPPPDVWMRLELLGPDGAPRPFTGVARMEAGEGFGSFGAVPGALHLAALNALEEALPPGRYAFRRTGEGWTVSSPGFEVRAGETTSVELVARRQ